MDITEKVANRFGHLDLTGFTVLDEGDGNNWSYTVTDGTGAIFHGTKDDMARAIHAAALTAFVLRRDRGTEPTVLVAPSA